MSSLGKFDFSETYVLENERVRLGPLSINHIEDLEMIASAPEIWTYFLEDGLGKENFKKYILAAINQRKLGKEYPFVVFDKSRNQLAGLTRLYDFIPELQNIKIGHTWYGTAFQGTGINKHCKALLFEFAFEKIGVERIGFGVHGENLRSVAALKKVGCKQEGVLRSFLPTINDESRTDLLLFSVLKNEWFNITKAELYRKLKNKPQ